MKKILLAALSGIISLSVYGEDACSVKGRIIEKSSSEPVGWATVALMNPDSTIVTGRACDENGRFSLTTTAGNYILKASMMGFKDFFKDVKLGSGTADVGDLALDTDEIMLAAARVVERESLVEVKIDKVVMNVSQSAFAQGSNGLDLIKKAPGVIVDKDGNVQLNGKSVEIWIDGRPSHVSGKSLEALLRSTNGESIEKFELMEHPSAKYDAAGQGGIINIKTKKNFLKGLNGSLGFGGGTMYFSKQNLFPWQQTGWANVAYRTDKTNTFVNISEEFFNTPISFRNEREGEGYLQSTTSLLPNHYSDYNVKLGNDWFIDRKNTIGIIFSMPGDKMTMHNPSYGKWVIDGVETQTTSSDINNSNRSTQYSANLNYTHIFDESRSSEITANIDYFKNCGTDDNRQSDTVFVQQSKSLLEKSVLSDISYDIWSAKADYQTLVWKKFFLEAGGKWAFSSTDNYSTETETLKPLVITDFVYQEHIGALYADLAGQLGPKWSMKAGLRGEYTHSSGNWISAGEKTSRSYFDLFPTVFVGFNPSEKWRLSTSYSRRINRPGYTQLNPTKTYIDARTYVKGNPDILPQYSNDVSFSGAFGQHLSLSLGFNYTDNAINQVPSYDGDISILTYDNYGYQKVMYSSFNVAALPLSKWLQWTLSSSLFNIKSNGTNSGMITSSTVFHGYTDFSFILPKDWKIDIDGTYSSPIVVGAFKMKTFWQSNIAAKKSLMDGRMTLTIKLDDVFRSSERDIDILDTANSGFVTHFYQNYHSQMLSLNLTWNFGSAHQGRQRKVGQLDEMSRTGRSGLGGGN